MNEQQIRIILATRLREYRERASLTAKEVGDAIGKSEKTISAWEHGRGQPDADMLFALCKLYGITDINVFYGLDSAPSIAFNACNLSSAALTIARKYDQLDPRGQAVVSAVVDLELEHSVHPYAALMEPDTDAPASPSAKAE